MWSLANPKLLPASVSPSVLGNSGKAQESLLSPPVSRGKEPQHLVGSYLSASSSQPEGVIHRRSACRAHTKSGVPSWQWGHSLTLCTVEGSNPTSHSYEQRDLAAERSELLVPAGTRTTVRASKGEGAHVAELLPCKALCLHLVL